MYTYVLHDVGNGTKERGIILPPPPLVQLSEFILHVNSLLCSSITAITLSNLL